MIVQQAPQGSAIHRAQTGDAAPWGLAEQLLAALFDVTQTLAWMQSADGAKNINRPRPIPRPGVKPSEDETRIGTASVDLVEMSDWLAKRNPNQSRLMPPS